MKKYISYGRDKSVKIISTTPFESQSTTVVETNDDILLNQRVKSKNESLKLAFVCNWGQPCGISTYSQFIREELKFNVNECKVFSEVPGESNDYIKYCWQRGEPLDNLLSEIKAYNPNCIVIQHEWGIFPNTTYFMSFIVRLKRLNIPVVVVLHSIYEHLDKLIPLSVLDNVIVHTESSKNLLKSFKFKGNLFVIPHGCPSINKSSPIFNTFKRPYLLFGFGFGFKYKGVEMAIDAIKYLRDTNSKYKDILYIYACSESKNNMGIHENYYNLLSDKVLSLGLQDNVLIIKNFLEPELLDIYLRIVKMALFTYTTEQSGVFGSSGAVKIAMSYNLPVIASKSHLFDDIAGSVTQIDNHKLLAQQINKIFSSSVYANELIDKAHSYVKENSWAISAGKYIEVINSLV